MNTYSLLLKTLLIIFIIFPVHADSSLALEKGEKVIDFTLNTTEDKKLNLGNLKGNVMVLTFWTTWCSYCQEEMAELTKFYKEKRLDGIEVVGVNITSAENSQKEVIHFVKQSKLPFPVVLDVKGEVSKSYQVIGIPTSYIIDENGMIREKVLGPITAEMLHQALLDL
ncbi:TlpA disulfide reductase family protein [Metabacillus endolithicus]|uniref:TlpA disulfide reductase family protein n=1 Tax=Metabacillus endolithicus TaxID=1535204 RepID=A0ABW5BSP8_9BACI|nr:TlpA disulfide reductase family protein [Metabacillus endolithicus]UPG63004.1 TlpA family protein disulfide reductase [Metabacillus endolithicus]